MRRIVIAALLSVVCAVPQASARGLSRTGIVTAIDEGGKRFTCHWKTSDWVYNTGPKTVFTRGGARGSFASLMIGARVTVNYHLAGKDQVADRVAIATAPKTPY